MLVKREETEVSKKFIIVGFAVLAAGIICIVFFSGKEKVPISQAEISSNLQNAWQNNDLTTDE